jgi:hypothetical protein
MDGDALATQQPGSRQLCKMGDAGTLHINLIDMPRVIVRGGTDHQARVLNRRGDKAMRYDQHGCYCLLFIGSPLCTVGVGAAGRWLPRVGGIRVSVPERRQCLVHCAFSGQIRKREPLQILADTNLWCLLHSSLHTGSAAQGKHRRMQTAGPMWVTQSQT